MGRIIKCNSAIMTALLFSLFAKAQVQLKVAFNLSFRIAYSKEKSETFSLKPFTYAIPVSFGGIAKFNKIFAIDYNYSPSIISIKAKNKIQVNSNPNYTYSYQLFTNQFSTNFYVLVKDNSSVASSNKIYFTFGPSFMLAKIVTHSFSSGRGNTSFESNIRSSQEMLPSFDEIINNKLGFQIGMHVAKTYQNNRTILYGLQFFYWLGKFPKIGQQIEYSNGSSSLSEINPKICGINFSVWFVPKRKNILKSNTILE